MIERDPAPEPTGHSRLRRSAPLVVSAIALTIAATGIGVGAGALITGSQIKDGSITGADIRNGSINGTDIQSGAIEVSDLSKGALKGLDGKDGAQGPAGPAGPVGPAGADGAVGPAGVDGGGLVVKDANGATVVNAYNPTVNWDAGGTVSSFYVFKNGLTYVGNGQTGAITEVVAHPTFIYQAGANCTPLDNDFWGQQSDIANPGELVANPKPGYRDTPAYFRATAVTTPATGDYVGVDDVECRSWIHPSGTLVKLTPAPSAVPTQLVTLPAPFHVVLKDTTY